MRNSGGDGDRRGENRGRCAQRFREAFVNVIKRREKSRKNENRENKFDLSAGNFHSAFAFRN